MRHPISFFVLFTLGLSSQLYAQLEKGKLPEANMSMNRTEKTLAKETPINIHELYTSEARPLQYFALPEVTLSDVQTKLVSTGKLSFQDKIPTTFTPNVRMGLERKQAFAIITIPQYILNSSGQLEKLVSYKLNVVETKAPLQKTAGSRVYANHSVLANGNWYKIAIEKRGVYKVDYSFLKNTLGLDLNSMNTANIRVYGNGGEELAESNAVPRLDDLAENAIWVEDGGDGKFDAGDYFL
nr:hypothetical protein [Chitinophagaceae bacterium]